MNTFFNALFTLNSITKKLVKIQLYSQWMVIARSCSNLTDNIHLFLTLLTDRQLPIKN
jgi:hypothetical protein